MKRVTGMKTLYKDLLFVYLQPSVNKNSQNLAILTLQFDDITVKTIYTILLKICSSFSNNFFPSFSFGLFYFAKRNETKYMGEGEKMLINLNTA